MSKGKGRIPVNCNWQDMTGGQVVYASLPMTLGSKQLHNDYTLKGSTSLALFATLNASPALLHFALPAPGVPPRAQNITAVEFPPPRTPLLVSSARTPNSYHEASTFSHTLLVHPPRRYVSQCFRHILPRPLTHPPTPAPWFPA
jgi:hypothetical protein